MPHITHNKKTQKYNLKKGELEIKYVIFLNSCNYINGKITFTEDRWCGSQRW